MRAAGDLVSFGGTGYDWSALREMDHKARAALDRAETNGYLPAVRSVARGCCVPFWWHGSKGDGYGIRNNGTVCFVDSGHALFGVTADHVLAAYFEAKKDDPELRCQFGCMTIEPETRILDRSPNLDLATFSVSEVVVASAGAHAHASITWPTEPVQEGELLTCGGYPGALRAEGQSTADLPFQWFATRLLSSTPENIKLRIDADNFHHPLHGPELPNRDFGGMSGGPLFRFIAGPPIERLELVGFIYECQENLGLLYSRPIRHISASGLIAGFS